MPTRETPEEEQLPLKTPDVATGEMAKERFSVPEGIRPAGEGDLLAGRFSLQRQIGRGGAGTVFAAFDTKVGQRVAVKILHADFHEASQLERLRREVRASRPGHPNAVVVYDLFDDGRRRFLTMELIDGHSLGVELGDLGRLTVDRTVEMGAQIAAALGDLHAKGLVHRDVKPGNVLLTASGAAKICDMGLTRPTARGATVTETEMVVGTPAYMAPEQAMAGELTAASDVYALGLTLYQCLTGEVPLQEDTAVATLMLRQRSRPPKARAGCPGCPKWLDRLLRRMLDPDPTRRPTAIEVEQALTERRVGFRFKPRRRQLLVASVVAMAVVGSFLVYRANAHPRAATVEAIGSDVIGLGDDGHEIWRHRLDQNRVEVLRADLDGNGVDEVLVVGGNDNTASGFSSVVRHSQILVLTASGEVMTRIDPEQKISSWPYRYRLEVNPKIHALDLDHDGWLEVVAICRQRRYFPTEVLVYWTRRNVWDIVLGHPGFIYDVFPVGDGEQPGFRFLAVNNRLAMHGFLGAVKVIPPDRRTDAIKGRSARAEAPPFGLIGSSPAGGLHDYIPLSSQMTFRRQSSRTVAPGPDGGWSVTFFNQTTELDRYLNPADGPNAGRDLRSMRASFYRLIYDARPGFRKLTKEGVAQIRAEMVKRCGPLLVEPAYETIFLETVGRALAWADDPEGAVELLRPAFERLGNDDLGYRLAHLEAITGNLGSAESWLRFVIDRGDTRRAGYDAPHLLIRVAIEVREAELLGSAISILTGPFREGQDIAGVRASLWAGARLWWDESSQADSLVHSTDYSEDGDAVASLGRWRRGTSREDDPQAMRLFVEHNPDAAGIGRAALAASLLGNGLVGEAIEECDAAIGLLGDWAKDDFREHQNLQLVMAIRTVALLEFGDRELARAAALGLAPDYRPDLLPGILVAEVLAATEE